MRVDQIVVGSRRREDLGDIEGLSRSIERFGLLHPVVVDAAGNLVAGERRLRACVALGWDEIPTRDIGSLSMAEAREIELDENLRRKDLTPYERNKVIVCLAETAREVAREGRAESARPSGLAWASRPDSYRNVAERIGVPEPTIRAAEQHVAAVDKYPVLQRIPGVPQADAIVVAKSLDALSDEDRADTLTVLEQGLKAPQFPNTLAALAGKPPMPENGEIGPSAGAKWQETMHLLHRSIDGAAKHGGIPALARRQGWSPTTIDAYLIDMRRLRGVLDGWIAEFEKESLRGHQA